MNGYQSGHSWPNIRKTARGIVIKDGQILLIERWRDGLHYFSVPGGGIETGETPEQAALREIAEEADISVSISRLIYEMHDPQGHHHAIYLCEWLSGEPRMSADAPERADGPDNRYDPRWVQLSDIATVPFEYWAPIGAQLAKDVRDGFPEEPILLMAA